MVERKKIVFVDDYLGLVEILAESYSADYETKAFTNPKLALSWIRENDVDILVSDNSMPQMMGTELVKKVKDIKPDVHCIIFTGDVSIKSEYAQVIGKDLEELKEVIKKFS